MNSGRVLIFDIEGQFGFFKTSEVTRATLSFPFTRTSIIGIIGAILGKKRNQYWKKEDALGNASIALELINPVKHSSMTYNYTHTRSRVSIGGRSGISTYLPKANKRGFVTAVRLDLIRDIHYRIYFKTTNEELFNKLKKYLENNWCYFPTYLGHANLLANISFIGEKKIELLNAKSSEVSTVVPTSILSSQYSKIITPTFSLIMHIPLRATVQNNEITGFSTDNFLIPDMNSKKVSIVVKKDKNIFSVEINELRKNIVFMPSGLNQKMDPVSSIIYREE